MLAILLLDEDVAAVGTYKGTNFEVSLILVEPESANLAHALASSPSIVIEVIMGCTTAVAHCTSRDRVAATGLDWLEVLAVFGFIFSKQSFVIQSLRLLDDRELVNGKLVVLRA
jgi:hypothetical protein